MPPRQEAKMPPQQKAKMPPRQKVKKPPRRNAKKPPRQFAEVLEGRAWAWSPHPIHDDCDHDLFPQRIVVLGINQFRHMFYICQNREQLELNSPVHLTPFYADHREMHVGPYGTYRHVNLFSLSLWGLRINFSRDVFFLRRDFIQHRFAVMDGAAPSMAYPEAIDPWNALAETRPAHIMVDARTMVIILEEALHNNSRFHNFRACMRQMGHGTRDPVDEDAVLGFFRVFAASPSPDGNALRHVSVLVPGAPQDAFGVVDFEYDSLTRASYVTARTRHAVRRLANSDGQRALLDSVMEMWAELRRRGSEMGYDAGTLPSIEFVRRPRG